MEDARDEVDTDPGVVAVLDAPRDGSTGRFTKAADITAAVHPALRRKKARKRLDAKQRRTTVRTIKLVNPGGGDQMPCLIQVPIEPGFNNKGILTDPTMPVRYYLEKGFVLPNEYEGKIPGIDLSVFFCAVSNCWDPALATANPENGSERCALHEEMFSKGEIRYATSAREYKD